MQPSAILRRTAVTTIIGAAGCAAVFPLPEAPGDCQFPPGTAIGFAADASLVDVGLAEEPVGRPLGGGPPDELLRGRVYVTADEVVLWNEPPPSRYFCLIPPDDAGFRSIVGVVPPGWSEPSWIRAP
jgi:hypothetical protein